MRILLNVLLLLIVLGHSDCDALAEAFAQFGMCKIQISESDGARRLDTSQIVIVKDKASGLSRRIEGYELSQVLKTDFPVSGLDTFIVKEWTGGNHCCHWDYIITYDRASRRQRFQILGSAGGYADTRIPKTLPYVNGKPVLALLDDLDIQGMDWSPEWHLCYASSPVPTRVVVFDAETLLWKDVGPRSSRGYYDYDKEYAETVKRYNHTDPSDAEDRFMLALEAAYHIYMAGASNTKVDGVLYKLVPKKFLENESNGIVRLRERIIQKASSFQAVKLWPPD